MKRLDDCCVEFISTTNFAGRDKFVFKADLAAGFTYRVGGDFPFSNVESALVGAAADMICAGDGHPTGSLAQHLLNR